MSKEEIKEATHNIALFMGYTYECLFASKKENTRPLMDEDGFWKESETPICINSMGEEEEDAWYYYREGFNKKAEGMETEDFKYHSSWDWLMPVIQNINVTTPHRITVESYSGNMVKSYYHPHRDSRREWHTKNSYPFTIEGVYQAVVEIIKLIQNDKTGI